MIQFECSGCGKRYSVSDEFADRSTRCKVCQTRLRVPGKKGSVADKLVIEAATKQSPAVVATSPKLPPRTRRLLADADQMRRAFQGHPLIQVRSVYGDPPELYQIEYRVQGLARGSSGQPVRRDQHLVEIQLTSEYPRQSPKCKILTPIFHPNFDPTTICVGDHWTAAERLVDLVIRIGEMIAYQVYNVKSPLDGEAAMWTDLSQQYLPIDTRELRPAHLE